MKRQSIRELAAIFQRQHGLDALRMAEERRGEHLSESDGFQLWDAIARVLWELQSYQLNQPLTKLNEVPVRRRFQ